jgi:hypothetical protein
MIVFARWAVIAAAAGVGCVEVADTADLLPPPIGAPDAGQPDADPPDPPDPPDAGVRPDAAPPRDAGPPRDILDRLQTIQGLEVEETFASIPGTRAFLLRFLQPEDHRDLRGPWFAQRLVLVHKSEAAPMVLHTTGYGLFGDPNQWASYLAEPTAALDANQITVEHRFFGESIADEPTWIHLNVEQSANDSHRIVTHLGAIYGGAWVGTGVSKGGMTAIFHHRFFPDDLAAIVPYVAPISFGVGDPRYIPWVAQIGPPDGVCRERVLDLGAETIERRSELADYFIAVYPDLTQPFTREQVEAITTLPTFGWHWGFWQAWGSPEACAALPPRGVSGDELALWFPFSPEYVQGFGFDPEVSPYYYQVSSELGGQSIDDSHLEAAASEVDYSVLPTVTPEPFPWGADPPFDPQPMLAVDAFLRSRAEHVLGVYGEWDPWSGGIITVDEATNENVVVLVPQIGHAAQIALLPAEEQDALLDRLHTWVGRSTLVAPDFTRARERMAAHRSNHERMVRLTLGIERTRRPRF